MSGRTVRYLPAEGGRLVPDHPPFSFLRWSAAALARDFIANQRAGGGPQHCALGAFATRINRPTRQGTCRTADKQSDLAVGFAAICPPIAAPPFPVFIVAVAMRLRFRLVSRNREGRWYGQRRRRE